MPEKLNAVHQVIYSRDKDTLFGYFAWPTLVKTASGKLILGSSGFRTNHVDPFGKSVIFESDDNGQSWSEPAIVNNSLIDDRDVGLLPLPDGRLLLSWFTQDTRRLLGDPAQAGRITRRQRFDPWPVMDEWRDEDVQEALGSFVRIRSAEGKWGKKIRVSASAPHGPILLSDGRILYVGRGADPYGMPGVKGIHAIVSSDGENWQELSRLPLADEGFSYWEPHAIELKPGVIMALLRRETGFEMWKCVSMDGGKTWSKPVFLSYGNPPHLLRHSSGTIVCTFGYRRADGYGQRVLLSGDEGETWKEFILRDDGFDGDLGYPSTVELPDGSLYTAYYQRTARDQVNNALQATHWNF